MKTAAHDNPEKDAVGLRQKIIHEAKAVGWAALYFGCWIAALVTLKQLILAEYQIEFNGMSKVLVGALVLSKVVLVLEHVRLGPGARARPAWVDVLLRTALYAVGVFVVLLLEKAFEGRHEYGGFGPALAAVLQQANMPHVLANTLCLSAALLGYNLLTVLRRHLGAGGLFRLLRSPLPEERASSTAKNER